MLRYVSTTSLQGDSGSPFVYKSRLVLGVLVGGFRDDCDGRVFPSIFIKIENFLNFINKVLNVNITNDMCKSSFNQ